MTSVALLQALAVNPLKYSDSAGSGYDSFGNLLTMEDLKSGYTEGYYYDHLHRLTNLERNIVSDNLQSNYDYGYDSRGNITNKSDFGSNYRYGNALKTLGGNAGSNAVRQLTKNDGTRVNYHYDNNGNQLSGDNRTQQYNLNNKPTSITKGSVVSTFYYGTNGNRYKHIANDQGNITTTYYAGSTEHVVSSSTTETRTNLGDWGIRTTDEQGNSKLRFVHRDRLGSALTMTSATIDTALVGGRNAVVELRAFDVFGKLLGTSKGGKLQWGSKALTISERGFTGHEHLTGVDLIHMNGRVYDPQSGRFLSVDPFIQSPENSQSINPYSYIGNNPLAGLDPTGYKSEKKEEREKPSVEERARASEEEFCRLNPFCGYTVKQTGNGSDDETGDKAEKEAPGSKSPSGATTGEALSAMGDHITDNWRNLIGGAIQGAEGHPALGGIVDFYGVEEAADGTFSLIDGDYGGAGWAVVGLGLSKVPGGRALTEKVRHFTNNKGLEGIRESGLIKASDQNSVFTVKAKGKVGSARDIEQQLRIKKGRANNYIEFYANPSEFKVIRNPDTGAVERVFKGNVDLTGRNASFHKNR